MVIKAVLFDLDGTLIDTLSDLTNAINFGLDKFGQSQLSPEQCRRLIGNGGHAFVSGALADDRQDLHDDVLGAMWKSYRDSNFACSRIYDGIEEMIDTLRQRGVKLAVVTNKDQAFAEKMITQFFGEIFDCISGVRSDGVVKPDPGSTLYALDSMGVVAGECLFVGDSDVDIITAKAAGIRSVGTAWGFRSRGELKTAGADYIIDSPAELLDYFQSQPSGQ